MSRHVHSTRSDNEVWIPPCYTEPSIKVSTNEQLTTFWIWPSPAFEMWRRHLSFRVKCTVLCTFQSQLFFPHVCCQLLILSTSDPIDWHQQFEQGSLPLNSLNENQTPHHLKHCWLTLFQENTQHMNLFQCFPLINDHLHRYFK